MLNAIKTWYATPYKSSMNVTGWFLMVGLVMVAAMFWSIMQGHLRRAIED